MARWCSTVTAVTPTPPQQTTQTSAAVSQPLKSLTTPCGTQPVPPALPSSTSPYMALAPTIQHSPTIQGRRKNWAFKTEAIPWKAALLQRATCFQTTKRVLRQRPMSLVRVTLHRWVWREQGPSPRLTPAAMAALRPTMGPSMASMACCRSMIWGLTATPLPTAMRLFRHSFRGKL